MPKFLTISTLEYTFYSSQFTQLRYGDINTIITIICVFLVVKNLNRTSYHKVSSTSNSGVQWKCACVFTKCTHLFIGLQS